MTSYGLPLGRLYGPAWLNGDLWSPGHKCVWTVEKDQSGHHCPDQECNAEIKTRCYDKLHVAFCVCLVTMANGHQRFCGHRFQAESPKACALHGWGENDENRVFQRAKKGLGFKLPELIPHEQSGWEMVLSGVSGIQQAVHIRMGLINGELCFVRVLSGCTDGEPDQVSEIARVSTKELLMTNTDPRVVLTAYRGAVGESPQRKSVRALAKLERNDGAFNDPCSYEKYDATKLEAAAARKLEEKRAKEIRAEEQAARRLAASRAPKRCADEGLKAYKRLIRGKKK